MSWKSVIAIVILFCFLQVLTGQKSGKGSEKLITITGSVLTPDKKPIEGAIFYIDNIKTRYKTNTNGSFRIKVSPSIKRLKVSSSVFGSADTIIKGQTRINFMLSGNNDIMGLNHEKEGKGIVHPGTYQQGTKVMNTYTDIYQMIRNEVSGVVVNGRSIVVQQQNSFFGSSEPLFVVNGVIVNNIDFVSPTEVRSISLLKGSAASIYGIQGANGVIIITLLNGSEQK